MEAATALVNKSLVTDAITIPKKSTTVIPIFKHKISNNLSQGFGPYAIKSCSLKLTEHAVPICLYLSLVITNDSFQFAYKPNRCIQAAVIPIGHFVSTHPEHLDEINLLYPFRLFFYLQIDPILSYISLIPISKLWLKCCFPNGIQ